MSAYWFTYSWMPGYLHAQRHFSFAKSAWWILVTQTGGFLGYFTFGFAADRIGRRPAYSLYSLLMALGLVMITVCWGVVAAYPPVILGFMFLVGFGTGMFGGYGPLFSELFPTAIRNAAMGSAFTWRVASSSSPPFSSPRSPHATDSGRHLSGGALRPPHGRVDLDLPGNPGRNLDVLEGPCP